MIITETRYFSTFQVAKICGAFHTTVINWVNKGRLKARTTPGGHRRIAAADLVDFMKRFEMPIPADLAVRAKRILIVEDDLGSQRMFTLALETLPGVEVAVCSGGLEALLDIGKNPPDLVVLDIRIPQVDGFEVCRVLRASEATKPLKVIAVTGDALDAEQLAFLRQNADGYFQKPIPTRDLSDLAAELLELEPLAAEAAG
ncbi:MAG: response regulator receiver protein [Elusimicrobia bacterium]|nr:MAG: response regulator receiver protein [Elusimicrobiota bacterium]